ncbi:hypothetical protein IPC954_05535 [Pseudomonas aeruginosa]|nr:hypothetical protein IPC976_03545 [Pseudomonas aeruginosa]RPT72541.1 hypothetical protein IPC948_12035 [Pseudomonas aeruginosa]RPT74089.1 hypothetical protein IPC954_05535 [Pseudomonas aeruginosa]RPT78806.1 hypothetical protein IPC946_12360 [Pseudomonas aeruginosa]RPU14446.1 hypothetical protein IPC924_03545 [Pseudomonas aeruginosa]
MSSRTSIILQPDCRTRAIPCVVLFQPTQLASSEQLIADLALAFPNRSNSFDRYQCGIDDEAAITLDYEVMVDSMLPISVNDVCQGCIPATWPQTGLELCCGEQALIGISPLPPPAQANSHSEAFTIRRDSGHQLLNCGAGLDALVLAHDKATRA